MFLRNFSAVAVTGIALAMSGCSTHPLPENVTRKTTYDIVHSILCEARAGIRTFQLTAAEKAQLQVGFDFKFDITEHNRATSASFDFLYPFGGGSKFSLNLNGGAEKKRQAERFFRVIHTFEELGNKTECDGPEERRNPVYPITGRVGIGEILGTYVDLRRVTKFGENKMSDARVYVFSDSLTYTTTFRAGIKPAIELKSIAGEFRLNKGSIDANAERIDVHKVVVAISTLKASQQVARSLLEGRYSRSIASPGAAGSAAGVILELDRLRNRDDDVKTLESLRFLPSN